MSFSGEKEYGEYVRELQLTIVDDCLCVLGGRRKGKIFTELSEGTFNLGENDRIRLGLLRTEPNDDGNRRRQSYKVDKK